MEKQERDFEIDYPFDWTYGVDIQTMKKDLEELEKRGVTRIDIEAQTYYYSTSIEIKAICRRLETDEECENRIAKENVRKQEAERREREAYEKLKAKFGQ